MMTPEILKIFHAILLRAFGDWHGGRKLDTLLQKEMGFGLHYYVPDGPLEDELDALITKVTNMGKFDAFVDAVYKALPANAELRAWVSDNCPDIYCHVSAAEHEKALQQGTFLEQATAATLALDLIKNTPAAKALVVGAVWMTDAAQKIDELEFHKDLHNVLHIVQITIFGQLRDEILLADQRVLDINRIKELVEGLRPSQKTLDGIARKSPLRVKGHETQISPALTALIERFDKLDQRSGSDSLHGQLMSWLGKVESWLQYYMGLLANSLCDKARSLPILEIRDLMKQVRQDTNPGDVLHERLAAAEIALDGLDTQWRNLLQKHADWQAVDNEFWHISTQYLGRQGETTAGFEHDWADLSRKVVSVTREDDDELMLKTMGSRKQEFEALMPSPPAPFTRDMRFALSFYINACRMKFQGIDDRLLTVCGEMTMWSTPLGTFLEDRQ
ncbi:hypothetical protein OVA03_07915 [Asticcacaulis sp. SL142]|uniref:hypothetical protein n=1 Tax=Asticcacaulis sp. SL142 TaxID=2995155 RepID=UPI00226C9C76|nr:hypothetical protein [Asticcacaulis sp. SL142]WAC49812.1 hypothetical protein OVA03_07915 [Asticcacaulis sp. SL142]